MRIRADKIFLLSLVWLSFIIILIKAYSPLLLSILTPLCVLFTLWATGTLTSAKQSQPVENKADSIQQASPSPHNEVASKQELLLPDQLFFNEIFSKSNNYAKRHNKSNAVLLIEIERLHEENVDLNAQILKRILATLRAEDIIMQPAKNQFIILISDIGQEKFASSVAQKILHTFKTPFERNHHNIKLSAKIGIALYPHDGLEVDELLQKANSAIDKIRNDSNISFQFYDAELNQLAQTFLELQNELRKAVEKNELSLYYQPQIRVKTGSITGVESLLRWNHPTLGNVPPAQIITLAEETGLIVKISEWAILQACKVNKYWQDEGYEHIDIGVNISAKQFYHPNFVPLIRHALRISLLTASYLTLEINESTIMSDTDNAGKIMADIHRLGVKIVLDHFGTGYTSISQLKHFPLTAVKIDRLFIKGTPDTPNDTAITNAFISLAHHLGLEVIAEGVETANQAEYLTLQDCDILQGYYLGHPQDADTITHQLVKLREGILF
ncbi:MAG: EAL domain-containing protein [Gammaproteobacteria bacterium]|nr:EAL domain-containing protein [Gammaproteobacteria bacterium]